MTNKSRSPDGSIYDTLYVSRMSRESRANVRKPSLDVINVFDASQSRDRNRLATLSNSSLPEAGTANTQVKDDTK